MNKVLVTIRPIVIDPRVGVDFAALEQIEDPEERRRRSIEMEREAIAKYRASLGLKPTPSQQPTLPRKYSSADTTDLELEVVADQENEFEIVLTDQGLRREHRAASTAPLLR